MWLRSGSSPVVPRKLTAPGRPAERSHQARGAACSCEQHPITGAHRLAGSRGESSGLRVDLAHRAGVGTAVSGCGIKTPLPGNALQHLRPAFFKLETRAENELAHGA